MRFASSAREARTRAGKPHDGLRTIYNGGGGLLGGGGMADPAVAVTTLLHSWRRGDPAAFERLMPLVYDELRRRARHYLRGERPNHTLRPTALVNEAYLRLVKLDQVDWQDRTHFFVVAARQMRRILVDSA